MTTNVPQDVIDDIVAAHRHLFGVKVDAKTLTEYQLAIYAEFAELRAQRQQGAEPVAWMFRVNHEHTVYSHIEPPSDAYDEGTLVALYTTPPQANALVAAAYRKAAEICEGNDMSWADDAWNSAVKDCANKILAAIPADAEAALREVCMKVAEKVCAEAGAIAINTRLQKDSGTARYELNKRLEAIVNSVLEGKSW